MGTCRQQRSVMLVLSVNASNAQRARYGRTTQASRGEARWTSMISQQDSLNGREQQRALIRRPQRRHFAAGASAITTIPHFMSNLPATLCRE